MNNIKTIYEMDSDRIIEEIRDILVDLKDDGYDIEIRSHRFNGKGNTIQIRCYIGVNDDGNQLLRFVPDQNFIDSLEHLFSFMKGNRFGFNIYCVDPDFKAHSIDSFDEIMCIKNKYLVRIECFFQRTE